MVFALQTKTPRTLSARRWRPSLFGKDAKSSWLYSDQLTCGKANQSKPEWQIAILPANFVRAARSSTSILPPRSPVRGDIFIETTLTNPFRSSVRSGISICVPSASEYAAPDGAWIFFHGITTKMPRLMALRLCAASNFTKTHIALSKQLLTLAPE